MNILIFYKFTNKTESGHKIPHQFYQKATIQHIQSKKVAMPATPRPSYRVLITTQKHDKNFAH